MANDFKIVLSSTVNTTELKTQLDTFFKNYNAPSVSLGSGGGSGNSSQGLSAIQKLMQEDEKRYQNLSKLEIQAYEEDAKRTAQKQADIQKLGKMQTDAYNMDIANQEKLNATFAKYQEQVDIFMAKTQNRDLSQPGAQGAVDVRNQMQTVLNGPVSPEAVDELNNLGGAAKIADANFQGLNVSGQSLRGIIDDLIPGLGAVTIALQAWQFVMQQIRDGVEYIKSLDKELNNIRITTGQDQQSVEQLGKSYNQTAKELSSTTLEVTKSAEGWIQQGKSVADTNDLVRTSTILMNIGNVESTQATSDLTAITNGYNISAKD